MLEIVRWTKKSVACMWATFKPTRHSQNKETFFVQSIVVLVRPPSTWLYRMTDCTSSSYAVVDSVDRGRPTSTSVSNSTLDSKFVIKPSVWRCFFPCCCSKRQVCHASFVNHLDTGMLASIVQTGESPSELSRSTSGCGRAMLSPGGISILV